jgi:hypothetical protein
MFNSKVMMVYRIISVLILSIPIAVNIYIKGGIVSSIIFVPLIMLGLSAVAIFLDGKLEKRLKRRMVLSKRVCQPKLTANPNYKKDAPVITLPDCVTSQ